MNIVFTGHRDCITNPNELINIMQNYPNAVWLHGGCKKGFDKQVHQFAENHNIFIKEEIIRPAYDKIYWKSAPLERNSELVGKADLIIACYDGRQKGGTFDTISKALKASKRIMYLPIVRLKKG